MSPIKKDKKNFIIYSSKKNLKKNKDSDTEDSDSEDSETIDSSDTMSDTSSCYETLSESEEVTPEPSPKYKKCPKKIKNTIRRMNLDNSEDEDLSDEDEKRPTSKKIKEVISKLLPTKYSSKEKSKSKDDKTISKKTNSKHNKSEKSQKDDKPTRIIHSVSSKKNVSDSEDDELDESEEDDSSDYNEDDSMEDYKNGISIIFGLDNKSSDYDDDFDGESELSEDENEECDSDDEKTFMKETYQQLDIPEQSKLAIEKQTKKDECVVTDKEKSKKNKDKKSKPEKEKPEEKDTEDEEEDTNEFESEYSDLVDMKKLLTEKLNKNPKSKYALKALHKCKDDIRKLIKKTRGKNTKEYHKLIHSQTQKFTNEIDYFKKKLSNKEQLKIMNDLKEINEHIQIDKPYRVALLESNIPTPYKATVMQKLNMLRSMDNSDPEYYKIKNWVDTFMRIPFGKYKALNVSINDGVDKCQEFMDNSMKILDECTYGLNDAKMQILQMVGQWVTNPSAMGTAIAIHGPMGTGKTTLVKEGISKILGREFAFIALGGAGDSSFLEGHSYTYEGSTWGKIIQILIDSKCMNPVIYFDELDKVSDTPRGQEIIGILTHLTDTSQNSQFHDKYFADVDFDLSKCLFIFSYNDEMMVNPILRDRMYRIQTKGYDTKQKVIISNNYLLPSIRKQVSFKSEDVVIPNDTIEYIASQLSKNESGVRNLKRCLEIIHTKLNLFRLVNPERDNMFTKEINMKVEFPITVTRKVVDALIKNEEPMNPTLLAMYV